MLIHLGIRRKIKLSRLRSPWFLYSPTIQIVVEGFGTNPLQKLGLKYRHGDRESVKGSSQGLKIELRDFITVFPSTVPSILFRAGLKVLWFSTTIG